MTSLENRKIAFFDIDGTLTSEIDGSVPADAQRAIRRARENGHLMFINTGRCFQNVEWRFRKVGFDGYVCGCGTHILLCDNLGEALPNPTDRPISQFHLVQTPEICREILHISRLTDVDILFESSEMVAFDRSHPLHHPAASRQLSHFLDRDYDMDRDVDAPDFVWDKFVIWYKNEDQLKEFRSVSDRNFDCIDRGNQFCEFVPIGYSKATGIQAVLEHYRLPLTQAYAFGDSANDLAMLSYVPGSVAMGNSSPASLKEQVSYVTTNASRGGIARALEALGFFK